MPDLADVQAVIASRLPRLRLPDRLGDILARAAALGDATDSEGVRGATAELLASLLQLCTEHGWDPADLLASRQPDRVLVPTQAHAGRPDRAVAVFTGSFDPPTAFHRLVVSRLLETGFDEVVVCPCGPRNGRAHTEHAEPIHRAVMADLGFTGLPNVRVDLTDLDDRAFADHRTLEDRYAARGAVWHVVPDDFVTDGRHGQSTIHTRWEAGAEMWRSSRFVVLHPPGDAPHPDDLPANHRLLPAEGHVPTADVRFRIFHAGVDGVDGLVCPGVAGYIRRHGLFASTLPPRETRIRLDRPRLMIVTGPQPVAKEVAEPFRRYESADPDLVLVIGGDGTMLHAIRKHWRLRLPFVGLNAGHLGFLLNERLPDELEGAELVLYRMPMLRVDVEAPDGRRRQRMLAFGDAWVERDGGQAAWVKLDVDGVPQLEKVVGDGLLVSTPAGSSAYSRAMGATPIPLNSPVLTLAGSNVFQPRFWKPLALPDSSVVRMTNVDPTPIDRPKRPVRGYLDGEDLGRVKWMEVGVSSVAAVELSFTPEFDLTSRRLRSLFPPEEAAGR